jgi:hypothetical protein
MKGNRQGYLALILTIVAITVYTAASAQEETPASPVYSSNYLYIQEYEIGTGTAPSDAISQAQEWVKEFRATGEYKSVRLYIHNTGPRFALYILIEPKSWQALEDGANKFFAANPGVMDQAFNWGRHSDNLLSEIPVD